MRRQQKGIFSWRRWHKVGELPMYGEFGGYPFIHLKHKITIYVFGLTDQYSFEDQQFLPLLAVPTPPMCALIAFTVLPAFIPTLVF